jgi:hypothetical protein
MLIAMFWLLIALLNAVPLNWLPWFAGLPLIDNPRTIRVKSDLILFMPKQAQSFGVLPTT